MEADSDRLLERARAGESTAAGQLVELYYERIYASLRRLSNNESDSADLTQTPPLLSIAGTDYTLDKIKRVVRNSN